MMNIPINFNIGESINNAVGKKLGGTLDITNNESFENIISNIAEKSSSLDDKDFNNKESVDLYTKDEMKDSLSSFEDLLTDLINSDEDIELNEDFSFLQNVMQLLISNNESIQVDKSDNFNINIDFFDINSLNNNISNKYNPIENFVDSSISNSIDIPVDSSTNIPVDSSTNNPIDSFTDTMYLNISNNENSILDNSYTKVSDIENFKETITAINNADVNNNINTVSKNINNALDFAPGAMSSNPDINLIQENLVSTIDKKITIDNSQELNLSKDANLILEFMSTLDEKDILTIENLDSDNLKKDTLINSFKEFLIDKYNYVSDNNTSINENKDMSIDAFYNTFKTSPKANDVKNYKNIDSLDSNGLIDLLSNTNILKTNNVDNSFKTTNTNNLVLHRDNISEDLQSSVLHMKNSNIKQLKLRLTPRELGEMVIDISQVDNISNIKLTVSNDETLSLMQRNLKEIVHSLKEANLISENSSVVVQSENSQREFSSDSNNFFNQDNNKRDEGKVSFDIDSRENLDHNIDTKIKSDSQLNILA